MPRKKISRTLPPLPNNAGLDDALHKTERLTEILRKVALKNQRTQPRAFYSVRDVAGSFHVTLSTASNAYRHLEQEGLLTRVRGSKTLLQGRRYDRRLEVRAFVGLPASLSVGQPIDVSGLPNSLDSLTITDDGKSVLAGFPENTSDSPSGELSELLKTYEVDTVIWFQPPREAAKSEPWLSDLGIRLIGIAHEEFPAISCRYQVRRDQGIANLLRQWKEHYGIGQVTLAQPKDGKLSSLDEILHDVLDDLAIKWSVVIFDGKRSEDFVRALQSTTTGGIIFSSSQLASQLCFRTPHTVADLMQARRVALLNGPVSMPFARVPKVNVDIVVVDWQRVAEKVVYDLITQEAFQNGRTQIFDAEAKLQVPLSEFAHSI